jgi:cytoplasmic iron level regulating protein YaaA (DUF328/UPF0246 family)
VAAPGKLKAFAADGYDYEAAASSADRLVFRRRQGSPQGSPA